MSEVRKNTTPSRCGMYYVPFKIKGYKEAAKIDYYVFAADESGRRCQQPVFGELDPHNFFFEGWDDVDENDIAAIEIFPNPMNDVLYIKSENIKEVTIFNAVGQQLMTIENENSINVSSLSDGLYFVRVRDDKGNTLVKKVVK